MNAKENYTMIEDLEKGKSKEEYSFPISGVLG